MKYLSEISPTKDWGPHIIVRTPNTGGLPELPIGQVWWVGEWFDYWDRPSVVVAIKWIKVGWFGRDKAVFTGPDGEIDSAAIRGVVTPKSILQATEQILTTREERKNKNGLLGYYPPNILPRMKDE